MRAAALAMAAALAASGAAACPRDAEARAAFRETFSTLLSDWRAARGLAPLRVDPGAQAAAQAWAERLAAQGRLAHRGPDGAGVGERLSAAGVGWRTAAENLAAGPIADAAALLALWEESPGHRANLASAEVSRAGLGLACGGDGLTAALALAGP
ncbi:CAP domain-containing protein [Albimonas pacifica]|uniref:Cysteine-rich secretory protein family protein n=1 Tax=Albimonas pacifica TaxID=1114924 RepID=A0A1I3JTI2_9RHOB|nr:CAP domain-containing protein [Albimonas pacifica]SFI63513.1 Cysteine-rich secretory protein family protein [Albimonas pacifica]